ncbi:hypothetical protein [Streptosporangium sp. V21-05]|uniref:hypothetical protein n=1 Tax=Streptosporangium sp. V21-05 TaxID=3446115 RepID=UPI003F531587
MIGVLTVDGRRLVGWAVICDQGAVGVRPGAGGAAVIRGLTACDQVPEEGWL